MSTIFISHSSADNAVASELLDWLKTQGYSSVFLDLAPDEGIKSGEHWEKVLYRELVSCTVVIALVTDTWMASKWCFAEATHARSGGKTILGLSLSRGVQAAILADSQSIDYSPDKRPDANQRLAEALRRAIDPQGLGRWDPTRPLFPGLLFFDERDAPIFFGRRRMGRAIYQKLRELQAKPPGSERLLLVFGPSGSGKSSMVRAGTLPHIHSNPDVWITLGPFRPTEGWPEPLRQSMEVLAGSDEQDVAANLCEIANQLRSEARATRAEILLIIDQLEEALDDKDGTETAFWLPLSRMLAPDDTPFMAMATLRSDFMGDFQKRSARNSVRFGSFPIEPMSSEDLREVIAGPCRVAGIPCEPSLVDALVEDASDEQALPLLALALNRLWLRHEDKQCGFTVTDYRDGLGGMRGLIDREAESTLTGKGLQEASVMDAFLSLTRLVREGVLARQPAAWDTLEPEAKKSLEPFISARLLVRYGVEGEKSDAPDAKGAVIVDLVHEILLSGWQRLRDWLSRPENRDFLPWREELRHKVVRWAQTAEQKGLLLKGAELKEAKKWLNTKRLALNAKELAYIQAGIDGNKISRKKITIAVAVLAVTTCGWWGWTQTDIYQIKTIESALPETIRFALGSQDNPNQDYPDMVSFTQLTRLGYTDLAIITADNIDNTEVKIEALRYISKALAKAGQGQQAVVQTLEQALATTDKMIPGERKAATIGHISITLAEAGQTQQALVTADKINFSKWKADALYNIARSQAETGQTQQAIQVLEQALAATDKIDNAEEKARSFLVIAMTLAELGQIQQADQSLEHALAAADKIDDAGRKAEFLWDIAQNLTKAGQTQWALTAADKINDAGRKADALRSIANALAKIGQTQQAIQALELALAATYKIDEAGRKAWNLRNIAQALTEAGQTQQAVPALKQALVATDKIDNPGEKAEALRDITSSLAEAGQTQQALAAVDKIDVAWRKAEALRSIAKALVKGGQTQQALATVDKIEDAGWKAEALQAIAKSQAETGQSQQAAQTLELALAAADKIDDAPRKTRALQDIGNALAEAGQTRQAIQVVTHAAQDAVDKTDDKGFKAEVHQKFAKALAATESGQTQQSIQALVDVSLAAADKIDDARGRANAFGTIAKYMADQGLITQTNLKVLEKAIRATEKISDEKIKSATYGFNATTYAELKQYRLARKTADKAKFAGDTLNGYMAILKFYAIEKHPELAEKLAQLEKEDKAETKKQGGRL